MGEYEYQISVAQFEGPFDLLLFFIERDEIDIHNIPIHRIIEDFLTHIHQLKEINIEMASDFILFASTLMRIKAKLLLPRRSINSETGEEEDPREELVAKLMEYKRYKQVAAELGSLAEERLLYHRRANLQKEAESIGIEAAEGSELLSLNLYRLSAAFERSMRKLQERLHRPQHVVVRYSYTMQGQRSRLMSFFEENKKASFENLIEQCADRMQLIFTFLNILELVQLQLLSLSIGSGVNDFVLQLVSPKEIIQPENQH